VLLRFLVLLYLGLGVIRSAKTAMLRVLRSRVGENVLLKTYEDNLFVIKTDDIFFFIETHTYPFLIPDEKLEIGANTLKYATSHVLCLCHLLFTNH
jgi:hypothetical protein